MDRVFPLRPLPAAARGRPWRGRVRVLGRRDGREDGSPGRSLHRDPGLGDRPVGARYPMASTLGRRREQGSPQRQREGGRHQGAVVEGSLVDLRKSLPLAVALLAVLVDLLLRRSCRRTAQGSRPTAGRPSGVEGTERGRRFRHGRGRSVRRRRPHQAVASPKALLPRLSGELGALSDRVLGEGERKADEPTTSDAAAAASDGEARRGLAVVDGLEGLEEGPEHGREARRRPSTVSVGANPSTSTSARPPPTSPSPSSSSSSSSS